MVLNTESPTIRTNIEELKLVSNNLDNITNAGGYLKWKPQNGTEVWNSIQKIKNKFPTEPLPDDGTLWGIAESENGLIKVLSKREYL